VLVLDVSGKPALTGLFVALRTLPQLLQLLPAGAWLDRWNRKRVMLLADGGRALVLGTIPFVLALGWPALPFLAAGTAISSAALPLLLAFVLLAMSASISAAAPLMPRLSRSPAQVRAR